MRSLLLILLLLGCGGGFDPSMTISCGDHCGYMPATASGALGDHLANNGAGLVCVPYRDIAYGKYYAVPCTSILGLEGRCLGTCIPEVGKNVAILAQDVCDPGEVCVPCWNPFANAWTSACWISGDYPRR
jgi:hypothetical protein